jgi:hypothetical protein
MKKLVAVTAILFSGLAVARMMPIFGVARFGEASATFGGVALPVPFMPLWATITLAVALWVVVYLMRNKEI